MFSTLSVSECPCRVPVSVSESVLHRLMPSLGLFGFFLSNLSLTPWFSFFSLRKWSNFSSTVPLNVSKLMGEVNLGLLPTISQIWGLFIDLLVPIHITKMFLLNVSTDTLLRLVSHSLPSLLFP